LRASCRCGLESTATPRVPVAVSLRHPLTVPHLQAELEYSRSEAARNPSDASILHARRAALAAAATAAAASGGEAEGGEAEDGGGGGGEDGSLARREFGREIGREVGWAVEQIRRAPWQEVLWQHHRILLCWLAAGPPTGPILRATHRAEPAGFERGPAFRPADAHVDSEAELAAGGEWLAEALRYATPEQREVAGRYAARHEQWCAEWRKGVLCESA